MKHINTLPITDFCNGRKVNKKSEKVNKRRIRIQLIKAHEIKHTMRNWVNASIFSLLLPIKSYEKKEEEYSDPIFSFVLTIKPYERTRRKKEDKSMPSVRQICAILRYTSTVKWNIQPHVTGDPPSGSPTKEAKSGTKTRSGGQRCVFYISSRFSRWWHHIRTCFRLCHTFRQHGLLLSHDEATL